MSLIVRCEIIIIFLENVQVGQVSQCEVELFLDRGNYCVFSRLHKQNYMNDVKKQNMWEAMLQSHCVSGTI